MAMTLRLPPEDSLALARTAELEDRSQHEIVIIAIRDYIERRGRATLIEQVMNSELPRYAEALDRLGQ